MDAHPHPHSSLGRLGQRPICLPELLDAPRVEVQHVALQINEEATLHNRLLEDLDEDVVRTGSRLRAAQRRLRSVMQKGGSCKTQLFVFLVAVIFVVVVILAFKIAIRF